MTVTFSPELEAELRNLADKVFKVLTVAGFAVHYAAPDGDLPGVEIEVDAYGGGAGVYVQWLTADPLTNAAIAANRRQDLTDPVLVARRVVSTRMFSTLTDVLTAAGFALADDPGDYRDMQIKVLGVSNGMVDTLIDL